MRFTVRESTLDGYRRIAEHYIKPHLGDKKISSVTTADIQKMYNWLRENGRINEHYERGNSLGQLGSGHPHDAPPGNGHGSSGADHREKSYRRHGDSQGKLRA